MRGASSAHMTADAGVAPSRGPLSRLISRRSTTPTRWLWNDGGPRRSTRLSPAPSATWPATTWRWCARRSRRRSGLSRRRGGHRPRPITTSFGGCPRELPAHASPCSTPERNGAWWDGAPTRANSPAARAASATGTAGASALSCSAPTARMGKEDTDAPSVRGWSAEVGAEPCTSRRGGEALLWHLPRRPRLRDLVFDGLSTPHTCFGAQCHVSSTDFDAFGAKK